ncbi:hypothetical protein E6C27_scaffold79G001420 [Cucumis melo var. makuwa]|uniref:Protein MNN4-like n=1 Tax=Cucumis melo var. makuwa TaxID=1194695 RepID=A0A5A7VAE2_CUCMM|nr:hypothetical protein E6C27_scaffold79G001420 [Cucumis melo var. makuwa]
MSNQDIESHVSNDPQSSEEDLQGKGALRSSMLSKKPRTIDIPVKANPFKRDTEVVHSHGPVSEQAQLASSSLNKALPSSREVFGTKGWNPFSFKSKEVLMTNENIDFITNLLMEESNKRAETKEEVEKKRKEDEEKARKEKAEEEERNKREEEKKKKEDERK